MLETVPRVEDSPVPTLSIHRVFFIFCVYYVLGVLICVVSVSFVYKPSNEG